jgi:hypothetical protein
MLFLCIFSLVIWLLSLVICFNKLVINWFYAFCKNAKKDFNFRGAEPPYNPLIMKKIKYYNCIMTKTKKWSNTYKKTLIVKNQKDSLKNNIVNMEEIKLKK